MAGPTKRRRKSPGGSKAVAASVTAAAATEDASALQSQSQLPVCFLYQLLSQWQKWQEDSTPIADALSDVLDGKSLVDGDVVIGGSLGIGTAAGTAAGTAGMSAAASATSTTSTATTTKRGGAAAAAANNNNNNNAAGGNGGGGSASSSDSPVVADETTSASASGAITTSTTNTTTSMSHNAPTTTTRVSKKRAAAAMMENQQHDYNSSFGSASASSSSSSLPDTRMHLAHWIVLCTHTIHRLSSLSATTTTTTLQKGQQDSSSTTSISSAAAIATALLSFCLSNVLIRNTNPENCKAACVKLEKAASGPARHLLGRALLTATAGSLRALQVLTTKQHDDSNYDDTNDEHHRLEAWAIQAATLGLDQLVHLQVTNNNLYSNNNSTEAAGTQQMNALWHQTRKAWESEHANANTAEAVSVSVLQQLCTRLTEELDFLAEYACLEALRGGGISSVEAAADVAAALAQEAEASASVVSTTPSSKRTSSRRSTTRKQTTRATASSSSIVPQAVPSSSSSPAVAATNSNNNNNSSIVQASFTSLFQMYPTNTMKMDGRVALRRWSSVALVWLCQGQPLVLQAAEHLLSASAHWGPLLESSSSPKDTTTTLSPPVVVFPGNVTVVTLACRLARIVWEAGNACGSRPPTGGLEAYMRAIWPAVSGTAKQSSASTKKGGAPKSRSGSAKLVRSDVRDLATVVVYKLIQVHNDCLESNLGTDSGLLVVNDFETLPAKLVRLPYYPFVHRAIEDLARAASSSVPNAIYPEQTEWCNRIDRAAAAFIFQRHRVQDTTSFPLDAKLTSFAIGKLLESFSHGEVEQANAASDTATLESEDWRLGKPIPVPQVPESALKPASASRKKKKSSGDATATKSICSFAGIYETDTSGTDKSSNRGLRADEILSLFIRSMEGNDGKERTTELISYVIAIVERCYDTRNYEDLSSAVVATASVLAGSGEQPQAKKRKLGGPATRRTKKTKTAGDKEGPGVMPENDSSSGERSPMSSYSPIRGARSALASDALDVLQSCMLMDFTTTSRSQLARSLRSALTVDQIGRLVDTGPVLEHIVVKTRALAAGGDKIDTLPEKFLGAASAAFSPHEKKLWMSHMNMCLTLGRGKLNYDDSKRSILGVLRLEIFKRIASSETRKRGSSFPLWYPAAHRVLVAANLGSETILPQEADADRFVVENFLSTIAEVLERPDILWRLNVSSSESISTDDHVPLSLDDARIFLAAVTRLSPTEQAFCLSSLLNSVESRLIALKADRLAFDALCEKAEIASFVARVVTLCTHMAIVATCGSRLRQDLLSLVGKANFSQLPTDRAGADWYRPETCFMSVYWDWESSELPDIGLSSGTMHPRTASQLQSILKLAFTMGFSTASVDQCHLLFAAWNALGKSSLWKREPLEVRVPTALPDDLGPLILELRNEVCTVHRLIQKSEGASSESSLLYAIDASETTSEAGASQAWAARGKQTLFRMIRKASALIDMLLQRFVPEDSNLDQDIPAEVFSLLEALAVYISFAVASHSKPENDFFSLTLSKIEDGRVPKRDRGYSSESEHVTSNTGSADSQDVLFDAVERLQEVCDAFGAVPAFPDWLDVDCRLRHDINSDEAREAALDAQKSLTKLVSIASVQTQISKRRALVCASLLPSDTDRRALLAARLCNLQNYSTHKSVLGEGPYREDRDLSLDIGSACGIDAAPVNSILSSCAAKSRHSAKGWWCPNSAQRVLGHFQSLFRNQLLSELDTPELRAAGEWEVLLGGTLTSACVHIPSKDRQSSMDEAYNYIERAERWQGVSNMAASSLMPVAALLRFGYCGLGRKAHPLSSTDASLETFESQSCTMSTDLPGESKASDPFKLSVIETLAVMARFSVELYSKPIAAHLMVDSSSFSVLYGMEAIRFALVTLVELRKLADLNKADVQVAASFLFERLAAVIDRFGTSGSEDARFPGQMTRLLSSFGVGGVLSIDTLAERDLDPLDALAKISSDSGTDVNFAKEWIWGSMNQGFVSELISFLWHDCMYANRPTRSFCARALSSIVSLERTITGGSPSTRSLVLLPSIASAFDEASEEKVKAIVQIEVCGLGSVARTLADTEGSDTMSQSLCLLFALLLTASESWNAKPKLILSTLEDSFDLWKQLSLSSRQPILNLLFLYGCRYNTLPEIGCRLVADLSDKKKSSAIEGSTKLENISAYTDFLRELRPASASVPEGQLSKAGSGRSDTSAARKQHSKPLPRSLPDSCSFTKKGGFNEQHWYNCYTCGLTWDKGCCTLCALICHQGHDVSYARYSSFFCDCGAEEGVTQTKSRESCKCASALPEADVIKAFARDGVISAENFGGDSSSRQQKDRNALTLVLEAETCAEIARYSFAEEAQHVLNTVLQRGREATWARTLFESMRHEFANWKSKRPPLISRKTMPENETTYEKLRQTLTNRKEKVDLQHLDAKSFTPLRISRQGAFKTKISPDSSIDHTKRALLSRHGISRSVVVADSRGRLVIAEPNSLLFCSGLPMVNVRHNSEPTSTPFLRSSMCVLGSFSVAFNIVGMRLSRDNESHLVAWGTAEAAVFVLDETKTKVQHSVTLAFSIPSHESSSHYVVKCEWIPGSQTAIVVACDDILRIFDLKCSEAGSSETADVTVTLGFQATVRDFVVTEVRVDGDEQEHDVPVRAWKVFVLLDNGQLHGFGLTRDKTGTMRATDTTIQSSGSITLPIEGISGPQKLSSQSASQSRSLGEGTQLSYLAQSGILIYQAKSTGVMAFVLGNEGKLESGFELLPHIISKEVVDGYEIRGPYGHWTELGVSRVGPSVFFRVACVGKRSNTDEAALICVEFNEFGSRVKELLWDSSGTTLDFSLRPSFDGVAAFSTPYVYNELQACDLAAGRNFAERVILCGMTSTGSLLCFAEEIGSPTKVFLHENTLVTSSHTKDDCSVQCPPRITTPQSFPVVSFEKLKNVTESGAVAFGGDGIGSAEEIRTKLSRENDLYLTSPRREGCTLIVSLIHEAKSSTFPEHDFPMGDLPPAVSSPHVLAGLRVLVGSTSTDRIPRYLYIEGRQIELTPGIKKWYSIQLTAEEIAISVRNGFIALGIGPPYDSYQNAFVDAVEVYATDRETVAKWLPKSLRSIVSQDLRSLQASFRGDHTVTTESKPDASFLLSLRALTCLCDLLGFFTPFDAPDRQLLEELAQESVLSREHRISDSVEGLLCSFEKDEDSRHSFRDGAVILGCSKFLAQCKRVLDGADSSPREEFNGKWQSLRTPLQDCLRAAAHVARCRQMNYLQAVDANDKMFGSIGADASTFIHKCFARSHSDEGLVSDYVELSLLEMAITIIAGPGPSSRGRFGTFDGLRNLLLSPNQHVVNLACASISRFCDKYGVASSSGDEEFSLFAAQKMGVVYGCDSCELLPINGVRYTLLDEDHPFDLCRECFQLGTDYAAAHGFSERRSVVIKGKTVGEDTKLTCAEVKMLQPVAVQKTTFAEEIQDASQLGDYDSEKKELEKAISLSLSDTGGAEVLQRQQLFDEFMNNLFSGVVSLLARELGRSREAPHSLIQLAVDLIRRSDKSGRKVDRAKRLSKELTHGLSRALEASTESLHANGTTEDWNLTVCTFLRALTNLPVQDRFVRAYLCGAQRDPEDISESVRGKSPFVCDVHGISLVRRKCGKGVHKDQSYYVCGMDQQSRCNYFAWADQLESAAHEHSEPELQFDDAIAEQVWTLLSSSASEGTSPLHVQLCAFLNRFWTGESLIRGHPPAEESDLPVALKKYDFEAAQTDLVDGAFCSRERIENTVAARHFENISRHTPGGGIGSATSTNSDRFVVESSLELLALVGRPAADISSWYSLLCVIIHSSDKSSGLRSLAKRALMQLSGRQRDLYLAVRDHHVFGFQFEKLIQVSGRGLRACLLLKEKARQCGPNWRSKDKISLDQLKFGEIFGTQDLVSEDVPRLELDQVAYKMLCELLTGAKKRGNNWRRFCGLSSLPKPGREHDCMPELFNTSPVTCLLWLACAMGTDNLVKVLKLVDLALARSSGEKKTLEKVPGGSSSDDQVENRAATAQNESIALPGLVYKSPEEMLSFSVDDAYSFAMRFVCRGSTVEIRRLACNVAAKICNQMEPSKVGQLFERLIGHPLCQTGEMGNNHVELLALLQSLPKRAGRSADTASSAAIVQSYWKQQILAIRQDRANGEYVHYETRSKSSVQRKRFELASCAHCHRVHQPTSKRPEKSGSQSGTRDSPGSQGMARGRSSSSRQGTSNERPKTAWVPEQVSPYVRGRLDAGRDSCTSNEFCTYFSLYCRLAVSEVFAEISDPRGRYVKTITVYYTPRPVSDPSILKSEDYADKWQPCGTLNLTRGATRASCTLTKSVIAANIKIEYTDFYERAGGSKSSDGSLLVHCPRCTRVVTNAHGVCGNCGEVAFQCRKCRHINYDRLDAFLCVECGYCASGSFSFELQAGAASNAIAIANDEDYARSVQMISVASRLQDDLRSILKDKLASFSRRKKGPDEEGGPSNNAALRRAFAGNAPLQPGEKEEDIVLSLEKLGKQGAIVKAVARPESGATSGSATTGSDRTRSLLRLARQWRSDSSNPERRRSGDVIIRHLGRGAEEEGMELLQLLEAGGGGGSANPLDPSEPLGRLLASVQSRREQRRSVGASTAAGAAGAAQGPTGDTAATSTPRAAIAKANKESLDLCERLHLLMREAEREAYELNRRIQAWHRLEQDCLADVGSSANTTAAAAATATGATATSFPAVVFSPSHCSGCCATTLVNLVLLWLRVFQSNPESVLITKELIDMLLQQDGGNVLVSCKSYQDWRRTAVKEIALKSRQGSLVVLEELRLRLTVGENVNCAEILGKILEHEDAGVTQPFLDLAMQVLETSRE